VAAKMEQSNNYVGDLRQRLESVGESSEEQAIAVEK
jgi:hexokinase